MAFCADDMQAADPDDLLVLLVSRPPKAFIQFAVALPCGKDLAIRILVVGGSLFNHVFGEILTRHRAAGQEIRISAQQDIRAAPCHVGRDGDGSEMTGLRHDRGFSGVVLSVKHLMGNAPQAQHAAEHFRHFDRYGTNQQRLACLMAADDLLHHGLILALFAAVYNVVEILADHGHVRRDLHDIQAVNALELFFLCLGCTRHAGELGVHAEIVLEGDGSQRL